MYRTALGTAKHFGQVVFSRSLQSFHGCLPEPFVTQVVIITYLRTDLLHQSAEWLTANEEVGALLIFAYLTQGNGAGTIAPGFDDSTFRWSRDPSATGNFTPYSCGILGRRIPTVLLRLRAISEVVVVVLSCWEIGK